MAWVGCRPGYQLDTAPARGTVILDGKPLSAGSVLLTPARGRGASGTLNPDGSFILTTYGNEDGAIVGKHKVAVVPLQSESESNEPPPGYVPVPSRYQNPVSSGLEVDVKSGEENVFDLELKS